MYILITHLIISVSFLLSISSIDSLTLSPIENIVLGSRLSNIKKDVKHEFFSSIKSFSSSSNSNDDDDPILTKDIVLIFPGAGGPDQFTDALEKKIIQCDLEAGVTSDSFVHQVQPKEQRQKRFVRVLDWSKYRGSIISAAYDSEAVGEGIVEACFQYFKTIAKTADNNDEKKNSNNELCFRSVHCIGISVGSFGANQCAQLMKEMNLSSNVRLDLMDPFTQRGITCNFYGSQNFGRNVDMACQFLNTDDPVPSTNDALPFCATIDVTQSIERENFIPPQGESMHTWPLVYFTKFSYESEVDSKSGNIVCYENGVLGVPERGTVKVV